MSAENTKLLEENRHKAKALRESYLAAKATASSPSTIHNPCEFPFDKASASKKRKNVSMLSSVPETIRDGRQLIQDGEIKPARKFKKYIDHDFSTMKDTKGGFLSAEDDPWNKAMNHNKDVEKPAHMTMKEWERYQLLKTLRNKREGPFEPGIDLSAKDKGKKCRECRSLEIDWQWEEVLKCAVCSSCKEKFPEKYSLLTKTEAKDDYLLTDRMLPFPVDKYTNSCLPKTAELKDAELLPHLSKPNPHKSHWHDMMLFLRYQVEEYAFEKKWGSAEALDAEFERRETEKKARKEEKFKKNLRELKKKTRSEQFRKNNQSRNGGAQFGDRIGFQGRHEHTWGQTVEKENGLSVKTCIDCGMEIEELEL